MAAAHEDAHTDDAPTGPWARSEKRTGRTWESHRQEIFASWARKPSVLSRTMVPMQAPVRFRADSWASDAQKPGQVHRLSCWGLAAGFRYWLVCRYDRSMFSDMPACRPAVRGDQQGRHVRAALTCHLQERARSAVHSSPAAPVAPSAATPTHATNNDPPPNAILRSVAALHPALKEVVPALSADATARSPTLRGSAGRHVGCRSS
ncbi:hypothetical protein GCM10010507_60100 [Streptomyces cinnamoneus]|uniref:Uncharacterized protein n=1 Tax=Streptomyces cinnamoneus TaxID=53446 RepID=A0A918TZ64_STRCJ|nr:hypothetical protein GCM10010507_60100 [Streptomyces cinnamoneus]